jgi:hypothetical protein
MCVYLHKNFKMSWIELIDRALPLIGVLIGTSIISWVFEKRKERRKVKADLISSINIFFNYRKLQMELANADRLFDRKSTYAFNQLLKYPENHENFWKAKMVYEVQKGLAERSGVKVLDAYEKLVEVESKILNILAELSVLFKKSKGDKVVKEVMVHINEGNDSIYLFDYNALFNAEDLEYVSSNINAKCNEEQRRLQKKCMELIDTVNRII